MTSQVVVALIASLSAMATSAFTHTKQKSLASLQRSAHLELRKLEHDLGLQGRLLEQRLDLEERLDRAGVPLLVATITLRNRIGNIVWNDFFDAYLHDPDDRRQQLAVIGTLHRFTNYWSLIGELTRTPESQALVGDGAGAGSVLRIVADIERALASDDADHGGRELMIWTDEQRAVGELARRESASTEIGFASFFDKYAEVFDPWLAEFRSGLEQLSEDGKARLSKVHGLLVELEEELRKSVPSVARASTTPEPPTTA